MKKIALLIIAFLLLVLGIAHYPSARAEDPCKACKEAIDTCKQAVFTPQWVSECKRAQRVCKQDGCEKLL